MLLVTVPLRAVAFAVARLQAIVAIWPVESMHTLDTVILRLETGNGAAMVEAAARMSSAPPDVISVACATRSPTVWATSVVLRSAPTACETSTPPR